MAQDFTMCVGTVGTGIWRSADGGGTWGPVREGMWSESWVYSLILTFPMAGGSP